MRQIVGSWHCREPTICQFCFEGFLVVRASCPRERDAHTTVPHFNPDRLLEYIDVSPTLFELV